jgi:hypothetical protein
MPAFGGEVKEYVPALRHVKDPSNLCELLDYQQNSFIVPSFASWGRCRSACSASRDEWRNSFGVRVQKPYGWSAEKDPTCELCLFTFYHHGYKMVQSGLKNHTTRKKQYMCRMMIMLCQWDWNEQVENLVRLLLYNNEKCSRKFQTWIHYVPSQ